ncbi:endo alpha-1,4 polygalactosaminidase [Sphingomonas sp. Leaf17]|uniref:endo alpha-1,4 polygalactosaminidase n=1 Tax=Sphingomonas sp. Leaf17 TaxID=1735683 RepID=UPI0006FA4290|nr:endo alpha-1,4 polygalactosaminidase [Sphingomonas sp. Leaf17]KQM65572.1 endo alpha-1,4 polygalactosaminidase [Sphingomonas sp. Leaf17]
MTPSTRLAAALAPALLLLGCGGGSGEDPDPIAVVPTPAPTPAPAPAPTPTPTPTPVASTRWTPVVGDTWQWQLSGTINTGYDVRVYDVDLVDVPQQAITRLHAQGRRVVCYFSAGSAENFRADFGSFLPTDLGNPLDGWPGERWLDIRSDSVRAVMRRRLDLAVTKGCDGVEPDNVDGYANSNGLRLTAADQLRYNRFLATEAHSRGLAVALKNDLDQVAALAPDFDFAVNEQCHEFAECDALRPFIAAGKPVFNAEYASRYQSNSGGARTSLCATARADSFRTLILPLELDDRSRFSCD